MSFRSLWKIGGKLKRAQTSLAQRIFGIVVCAAGEHKYNVRFENDTELKSNTSDSVLLLASLKFFEERSFSDRRLVIATRMYFMIEGERKLIF
jgi:hypothetical protein